LALFLNKLKTGKNVLKKGSPKIDDKVRTRSRGTIGDVAEADISASNPPEVPKHKRWSMTIGKLKFDLSMSDQNG